jgi:hypothetical protein
MRDFVPQDIALSTLLQLSLTTREKCGIVAKRASGGTFCMTGRSP